jgi:hypothetical protein
LLRVQGPDPKLDVVGFVSKVAVLSEYERSEYERFARKFTKVLRENGVKSEG